MKRGMRVGVLVPFTNTNLEPDLAMMLPEGYTLHSARMGGYDADEIPDAGQMQGLGASDGLDGELRLLLGVRPDEVLYGCTSATLAHGQGFDRDLATKIKVASGAVTVTAAGALVGALRALGVRRIGFASPYVAALNDDALGFLADEGFETVGRGEVAEALSNDGQGLLTPDDAFALGMQADAPEAEAIVLSCTDLRAAEAIARLEKATGKPVITSNQAMVFAMLRALGWSGAVPGFGRLLERI